MQAEWRILQSRIRACGNCRLRELRQGLAVPVDIGEYYGEGGILLLSERPGAHEGRAGRPMAGPSGVLLDQALVEAGLSRGEVAVDMRLRCRPPEDRLDEVPEALYACGPWTDTVITTLQPSVVVLLGRIAAPLVHGPVAPVGRYRGVCRTSDDVTYITTYHPAHALRQPNTERLIIKDLTLAKELRDETLAT